jgi:archaemetzincin
LQPVGDYPDDAEAAPPLNALAEYVTAFYGVPTRVLPAVALEKIPGLTTRMHGGFRQLLIGDIYNFMKELLKSRDLARKTLAVVAVTMEDLYPGDDWNFVYGQAYALEAVGVFSFARFHPSFSPPSTPASASAVMLQRSCKVLTHEIGHLAGLRHCIHRRCLLNGVNHELEMQMQPLQLCPLCLKKLSGSFKWHLMTRSQQLLAFYTAHKGFEEAAQKEQSMQAYLATRQQKG